MALHNSLPLIAVTLAVLVTSACQGRVSEITEMPLMEDGKPVRLQFIYRRPSGNGPFPLLIFNHGSTGTGRDKSLFRIPQAFDVIEDYFVQRGWMVVQPQRRGRGLSDGLYDEGFDSLRQAYTCQVVQSLAGADRALTDIAAAYEVLIKRPDVDSSRVVIGGQSRGGILAVAFAGMHPTKVKGVINFVGGWISDRCPTAWEINGTLAKKGAAFPGPMLWTYADRDEYYSLSHTKRIFNEFLEAGGKGDFVVAGYGHGIWHTPTNWSRVIETYMKRLGFDEF